MPMGQAIRQRQQVNSQEKSQKQKHCKSKNQHRFPRKERRKEERRDRCFSVALKYKDPSRKKIFKGPSEKIFFLTQHRSKARRFGDTCELLPKIFQKI